RGYQTRSLFNWRTPLYAWVFGGLPDPDWAKAILVALALAAILLAYSVVRRESGVALALATALLLFDMLAPGLAGAIFLLTELWAGVVIVLWVCACGRGWGGVGVSAGLLALFFRELALPYCVVALVLAAWRNRRAEVAVWFAGLALYGVHLALHALE